MSRRHPDPIGAGSRPRRFFVPSDKVKHPLTVLDGTEGRHLVKVLRGYPGQMVSIYDENGRTYSAVVTHIHRRGQSAELEIQGPNELIPSSPRIAGGRQERVGHAFGAAGDTTPTPKENHLILAIGVLKGSKLDDVVAFAAAMGVHEIHPFTCSRTASAGSHPPGAGKVARWQRIATAAGKMPSGLAPILWPVETFSTMVRRLPSSASRLILWEGPAPRLADVLASTHAHRAVALVIGPEGGFEEEEVRAAQSQGFQPVSLGSRILRSQYAAQTAIILSLHAMGQMG